MHIPHLFCRCLFLLLIHAFSCTPKGETFYEANATPGTSPTKTATPVKKDVVYFIYENGVYTPGKLDKEPVSIGGDLAFARATRVNYPAKARESGIQGIVFINVIINEAGQLEKAIISKGIGGGCDEEALQALQRGAQAGFEPAIKDGKPVKVKYDYPIKFSLQ